LVRETTGRTAAQVAEEGVVGDAVQVQRAVQAVAEVLPVLHRVGRSSDVVLQLVFVQILTIDGATVTGLQIAVLAVPEHAAFFHVARRDGRIHVGRDVPVERLCELDAALAGGACRGSKQAALALVVEREVQPGRIEDGRPQENQGRIARGAFLRIVVKAQIGSAHEPVGIAPRHRRTGAVGGIGEAVPAFALEIHARG
jgi:hypothetical protein